jgi:hypothetical protein
VHARAQSAARAGSGRGLRGGDTVRGFVRTSASGGELDREGVGLGHVAGGRLPAHGVYSARRARMVGLCNGLGAMLSTVVAWPAECAVRGRRRQAVGARIGLAQRQATIVQVA